ncbi:MULTISPECIES: hypothetical protein [Mycobacterium]|uniref:hypothetical protein n=1 Tax=Mycobacterium TaxID=1763 RepID=UPI001041DA17|nr:MULTISPECIES: hypothetical protein [Mycobacterium]MCG7609264.1 hypothetical protein [Mycobacterium sp. CnD-18-1]TMS47495.1 hypothetical protein E0T84_28735 [Mycobacterium sp. DBP42]
MTAACGAVIVLAAVASCGSGKPVREIEEDVTIPRMTIGETITGEPEAPAGDTEAPSHPPTSPEIPRATPPITTPPQVAVPH